MILYKALFDYESSETHDLFFKANDVIEFMSESSTVWYQGKNLMTGKSGLFPNNFVEIISIPSDIDEENIYVIKEGSDKHKKGDLLIKISIENYVLSCFLLNDENKTPLKIHLSMLIKVVSKTECPGFIKCIAFSNHLEPSDNEISFSAGDIIWMEKQINANYGLGIFHGKKGLFPLKKIYTEEIGFENLDRKNIWMTLYDYSGTEINDLSIKKGEKLRFLDRIDNNWNLMQNESGKVGMVPCSYLKNISINAPMRLSVSENEINQSKIKDTVNQEENININKQKESKLTPMNEIINQIKEINSNQIKEINSNQIKEINSNQIKEINSNQIKEINLNQIKEIYSNYTEEIYSNHVEEIYSNQIEEIDLNQLMETSEKLENDIVCQSENSVTLRPNAVLKELKNHQHSIEHEYENLSFYDICDYSVFQDNFPVISSNHIDGNFNESNDKTLERSKNRHVSDENDIPETILEQFNKRVKRIENDIQVIADDIKSIQFKSSREDSTSEESKTTISNLAFLKEEYKTKLKELECVKEQRQKLLSGNMEDFIESDYESIKLNSMLEKQNIKRARIIEEILETEKKFINDLKTTLEAYDKNLIQPKISDQDFNLLFGDLESVICVAEEFLSKLTVNIEDGFDKISVGSAFLQSVNSFEEVYKEYCVNYDRKLDLLNRKSKNPLFTDFITEGLNRLNNLGLFSSALDMMLVKPLQRFLKYPLFLKTIIENTQSDHTDISDLRAASSAFEILAQKINEKKRFEELRQSTFDRTEKWHMKTLHAIQKKPKRVIVSISGVQEEDSEFKETVTKFKDLKKCISFFIETVFILRDNLKEILSLYSAITDDLTTILKSNFGSELSFYLMICKSSESDYFKKNYTIANKICILDSLVVNPLNKLLELFSGPILLIKKRKSKYIDYLAMKQRCDDKDVSRIQIDKLEQLKNQYFAINNTLKHELPILISKSSVILNECVGNYLQLTTSSLQSSITSLRNVIGEDQLSTEEEQKNCRNQQNEIFVRLHRDLVSFNPQYRNSINKGDFSSCFNKTGFSNSNLRNCIYHQTEDDINKLKEKFEQNDLAHVKKDFVPTKSHQIHICAGTLVGILKRCNPQGHSTSWLVEVCPKRTGFVPRSYLNLSPFSNNTDNIILKTKQGNVRDTSSCHFADSDASFDLMQFSPNTTNTIKRTSLVDTAPFPSRSIRSFSTSSNIIRIALYSHQSRGESEISMQKNDQLEILENHDKSGSKDWSLVKNLRTGAQGYVPTNYLSK